MNLSLRHAVAVAAIVSMPLLAHAGDLAKAAPSDSLFVMWAENASFTKSKWEGSRMSEIWNAPEMGKMRTFFERKYTEMETEFEAEMEFPLKDLIGLVSGEAVVTLGRMVNPTPEENGLSEPEPGSSVMLAMNLKDSDRGDRRQAAREGEGGAAAGHQVPLLRRERRDGVFARVRQRRGSLRGVGSLDGGCRAAR
jgi:hypothetical protein